MSARAALVAAAALLAGCSGTAGPNEAATVASNEHATPVDPRGYSSGFPAAPLRPVDLVKLGASASGDGLVIFVDADALVLAYRRDPAILKRLFWGRRLMIKGVVRSVEPEGGNIYVLVGGRSRRDRVTLVPSLGDVEEERNARTSRVGALLAVSCGDVSMSGPDDVFLRDCTMFDPA